MRGIYKIVCLTSGHCYVGSSQNIQRRWHLHRCDLRHGRHHSFVLQRAWDKHGESGFAFEILEHVEDTNDLRTREQFWLDTLCPKYNLCPDANTAPTRGRTLGPLSDERKRKISEAVKGYKHTEETRAKMRGPRRTPNLTQAQKERLRIHGIALQARGLPPEARRRANVALAKNAQTEKARRNRSAALLGKPWSEARRAAHLTGKKCGTPKGQPWTEKRWAAQKRKANEKQIRISPSSEM